MQKKYNLIICVFCRLLVFCGSILSIDYVRTKKQKSNVENNKNLREYLIIVNNVANLIITALIFLFSIVYYEKLNVENKVLIMCLNLFFGYRFLFRSFEIILSFFKYICDTTKKSSLSNKDRILLAITSLIEMSILYFIYLYQGDLTLENVIKTLASIYEPDLCCNAQIGDIFFYLLYTLTSFVLISLTIVQYIANSNDKEK